MYSDLPAQIPYSIGIIGGLSDRNVRTQDKYGGGFVVHLEALHHLHCLVCNIFLFFVKRFTYTLHYSTNFQIGAKNYLT